MMSPRQKAYFDALRARNIQWMRDTHGDEWTDAHLIREERMRLERIARFKPRPFRKIFVPANDRY
jgi:hypothetical protein